jgi:hypothetical protein
MPGTFRLITLMLGAALATSACSSLFGADGERVVGIIEWTRSVSPGPTAVRSTSSANDSGSPDELVATIDAPDTVAVGASFTTVVTTAGLSGCYEAAGAQTRVEGAVATITPYDRLIGDEDTLCLLIVEHFPRNVKVRFDQPGEAILRVEGRRVVGGNVAAATPFAVERRIWVR